MIPKEIIEELKRLDTERLALVRAATIVAEKELQEDIDKAQHGIGRAEEIINYIDSIL